VQPFAKAAPVPATGAPSPKELVEATYGFAAKLADAQRDYWTAVAHAAEPATPRTNGK
jgi:hypothetical protein